MEVQTYGNFKPQDIQDKISNGFYIVEGNGKSWAISLAFAKAVVNARNGKVGVESNEINGTTFQLNFPLEST